MVEIIYRGGLGDWLFQYCLGRMLARRWGVALQAPELPDFPSARSMTGKLFVAPFRCWSGLAVEDRQTSALVRGSEMLSPLRGRLMLYGWFHRWELYRDEFNYLRPLLECAPPLATAGEGDLVVVMRHTAPEAWKELTIHSGHAPAWSRVQPSVESVKRLADRLQPERLVIVADFPQRVDISAFAPHRTELRGLGGFDTWNWLRSARRLVIAAGHASDWWAARLSEAEEIYVCDPWTDGDAACVQEYG